MKQIATIFYVILPFIWSGILIGISFIEAPLKFRAPGVTIQIGTSIGKVIFNALNKIEISILSTLLISYFFLERPPIDYIHNNILLILAGLILALQSFWLLPKLNTQIDLLQKGIRFRSEYTHYYYVIAELIKLLLLIAQGVFFIKSIYKTI